MARYVVIAMSGAEDGREWRFDRLPITIGRDPRNDVCLAYDCRVSRTHARLEGDGGGQVRLVDLDSTNGTFVGVRRVEGQAPLPPNTLFRVGHTWLRLRQEEP